MNIEICIENGIRNLLIVQKSLGYATANADNFYRALKEQNLLYEPIDTALNKIKFEEKHVSNVKRCNASFVDKIFKNCKENDIQILPIFHTNYPDILRNVYQPPLVLFVKGKMPDFDNEPSICIVGPRKATDYGVKAAFSLGYRMAKGGMIVVSGGALGCDSAAHKGALRANGKTVAVLGCGIGNSYLSKNKDLRNEIALSNCLISEFPPFAPVTKFSFPVRNRILSGLCDATVVVEAGEESGALITAKHANEQGREVFVIPGSPSLECYKGSNKLLRDGATPLTEANDIFNEYLVHYPDKIDIKRAFEREKSSLEPKPQENNKKIQKKSAESLSKEAKIVYNSLNKQQFTADDIYGIDLSDDDIISALTELEIEHYIRAVPGGSYIII